MDQNLEQAIHMAMSNEIGRLMIDRIATQTELQLARAKIAELQAELDTLKPKTLAKTEVKATK